MDVVETVDQMQRIRNHQCLSSAAHRLQFSSGNGAMEFSSPWLEMRYVRSFQLHKSVGSSDMQFRELVQRKRTRGPFRPCDRLSRSSPRLLHLQQIWSDMATLTPPGTCGGVEFYMEGSNRSLERIFIKHHLCDAVSCAWGNSWTLTEYKSFQKDWRKEQRREQHRITNFSSGLAQGDDD